MKRRKRKMAYYNPNPNELIVDGRILNDNMEEYGLDTDWIYGELRKKNIDNIKDVSYGQIQSNGELNITVRKKERNHEEDNALIEHLRSKYK
ncbi:YetF domain-containing protein [Haloplasma contractile]|uniref:YetF domain-containing protein n=1 Tax=Haloplasma contractile TaxID=471825 RepID=UPI0013785680|nr:YetF domain-containing protein [Haloplasma contractile]